MKTFFRLLSFAKPFGRYWPTYLLVSILSVLFGVAYYALVDPLTRIIFSPETLNAQLSMPEFNISADYFKDIFQYYLTKFMGGTSRLKGLLFVCLFMTFMSFLANFTTYISRRILVSIRTKMMYNVRKALFLKISRLHIGYFHEKRKGDILSSVSNDVTEVQNTVADTFLILFRDPLMIIGFLAALFYMSPQLTTVTLIALPITAFAIGKVIRSLRRGAVEAQSLMGRIVSHFEEAISGARIIKAFNAQKYTNSHFDKTNSRHRSVTKKMFNRQQMASPLSEFLGFTVAVSVLFYGGYLQINGHLGLDMPEFIVYIGFYWKVLEPTKSIANAFAGLQRGMVSGERIFAIMDVEPAIKKSANPLPVKKFKSEIEYKNVGFSYATEPVLKDINLKINKGSMIALVGPSGAGKSTMADLLPRFYDVTSGSIMLDGIDIRDYEPKELIGLMGIVTQEAILFNDTVFNNIAFGMENVSEEDVVKAAKIANADEFISQMEGGYQANIGDRGLKLSGGQRQRLAIARAVLKNPPILILDEATSALDTESERLVQEALLNLMKNRTSVVIAHRLSTIQHADEIVVIKEGAIVERGTHNELIEQKGLYSHLCDLQAFA
ncbi:MAG: ABC transporter ATP-binding protein [Bacteroidales bacterium]